MPTVPAVPVLTRVTALWAGGLPAYWKRIVQMHVHFPWRSR